MVRQTGTRQRHDTTPTRGRPMTATELFDAGVRVSRVGKREKTLMSPELQRETNERTAQVNGVRIARTFNELNKSGGKINDRKARPELWKAVDRAKAGKIAGIIVPALDRFGRNFREALEVMDELE